VVARCRVTTLKRRFDRGVDQHGILAVELEHPAPLPEHAHRLEDRAVGEPEVEDHECLRGRDARIDHRGQLGDRVVHPAEDRRAHRVVHRGIVRRHPAELVDARQQRAMGRRRRTRPRVVEGEEGRRPAERSRHRVLEEAIRLGVRGDAGVGVDVDHAREHQQPGRVDHLVSGRGRAGQVGLNRVDHAAAHGDVGAP
jgi:hypothetical protein